MNILTDIKLPKATPVRMIIKVLPHISIAHWEVNLALFILALVEWFFFNPLIAKEIF